MKRRRTRKSFDTFPTPDIPKVEILNDTRNMEYMSKFRDHHVRSVFYFALLGMTEEQMAVALDVPFSTFCQWKGKHPTFLEAIKSGKEQADAKMVFSLYQVGIGYEHASEQIFMSKEKEYDPITGRCIKEKPKVIRVPITKKYPPNVKAALRWLEIRQSGVWSQKKNEKANLTLNQFNFDINGLSMDELKLLQKIGAQNVGAEDVQFTTTAQKQLRELESYED